MKKLFFETKRFFMLTVVAFTMLASYAQTEANRKIVMQVDNVNYSKPEQKKGAFWGKLADFVLFNQTTEQKSEYGDAVRAFIVKGLSGARRVQAMDGASGQSTDYIVDATVSNISATSKIEKYKTKDSKGNEIIRTNTVYKGNVGVTLTVKNAQTGEVVTSPAFNISDYDCAWVETPDGAVLNTLQSLSSSITNYFNRCFPFRANIVESARQKKDKQKEVYIDLGSNVGAYSGIHFNVYTVKTVAGKEARVKVGKLKITDVQGDEISLCKVQSGGKDIKNAIDDGQNLLIESID